ncbi:unnamed protein product [Bursaphelenchus okinawaensis]|uniref:Uncharacterized protein n=1 Tax=Bursaphelenchus okinawaensis TaxID=465554 RepID=A0A811LEM3_9BILA|nr:unnamed protein product [Bursaphelenchus okinawaensis]CAG9121174.1 unnamed protein product [Bursaphelenchus okinawaensis]
MSANIMTASSYKALIASSSESVNFELPRPSSRSSEISTSSEGSRPSRPSSTASSASEASFLPLTHLLPPSPPLPVLPTQFKQVSPDDPMAPYHRQLDDIDQELKMIKVLLLSCRSIERRAAIHANFEITMVKYNIIKSNILSKVADSKQ